MAVDIDITVGGPNGHNLTPSASSQIVERRLRKIDKNKTTITDRNAIRNRDQEDMDYGPRSSTTTRDHNQGDRDQGLRSGIRIAYRDLEWVT